MTTSTPGSAPADGLTPLVAGGGLGPPRGAGLASSGAAGIGRAVEPELCRVSVLSGRTQVDVALPADAPVASLLPELAGLLLRNQFGEPERVPDDLASRWTLGKVGQPPIDDGKSLSEAGIYDGDLLILRSETTAELPTIYDDVIDAVAGINRREFNSWTPLAARWVGVSAFVLAVLLSGALTMAASWNQNRYDFAAIGFVAFVVFAIAALAFANESADRVIGAALSVGACVSVFVGCFAVLPGDDNAPKFLLGSGVAFLVSVVALRLTNGEPFTHLFLSTVTALVAIGSLYQVIAGERIDHVAAVTAVVALLVALIAPRLTILLVRLPVPPVPAAGASLESIDAPTHNNINAGVAAIGAVALPEATALELRARSANAHMSGMMLGAATVAAGAAVLGAIPKPDYYWQSFVLALLIGAAILLRGRSHSDLVQATGMISLGALTIVAAIAVQSMVDIRWAFLSAALVMFGAALAFTFGVITPTMEFSPVLRRIGEFLEYIIIGATVPLAAWVIGLYSLARGL
ncbi:type VII secretion integral membrane protein EccD [Williamsia sp. CHRR-6]|uniref:type VII secretion integral membrane protein EccD n=1 Tax=Williamsia sp. CHRR-6 TaxID=2835871 RepID=UPI001BDB4624|nr:type VII secretion integral membrane protein EccD [Williamsia sp. CHRR-6]MBT0568583.1 type VII secretion integral membrane protein EccD [Williamsia sp. CHRR-6]